MWVSSDSLVFLTRLALGAVAGFIFRGQVDGATAAVAVGASAPALLKQLGALHYPGEQTDEGTVLGTAAPRGRTDVKSVQQGVGLSNRAVASEPLSACPSFTPSGSRPRTVLVLAALLGFSDWRGPHSAVQCAGHAIGSRLLITGRADSDCW